MADYCLQHLAGDQQLEWRRLLTEDVIVYGDRELELAEPVPELIAVMRQFLKRAAADG